MRGTFRKWFTAAESDGKSILRETVYNGVRAGAK
jgi:hypothetical protein